MRYAVVSLGWLLACVGAAAADEADVAACGVGTVLCVGSPWIVCVLIAAGVGFARRRTIEGILLGGLFGPLGIVMTLLLGYRYRYACPDCGTGVFKSARRCPACRTPLA